MAYTLQQVLQYQYLMGLVEDIKTGIPNRLPPAFFSTKTGTIKDQGSYIRYAGTRQTARRAEYGSPSHKRELVAIGTFPIKLLHLYEHVDIPVVQFAGLRNYTSWTVDDKGMQEIDRQATQFRQRFDNTIVAAICLMLGTGKIYWDTDGNLLPSSSGSIFGVDYGLSANNQNQLNGIIAASWATATTDIPAQIRALKKQSLRQTGFEITQAFYGENIPSYLMTNNFTKDWLTRNPAANQYWLDTGELPRGLFGLDWTPVYQSFFEDANGNNQALFGADNVTFTPDINSQVYELVEGTYPVPTTFQPLDTLGRAAGSFDWVQGMFAYAAATNDPPAARMWGGHTFLPVWKVPDAMYIADTVP